MILRAWVRGLWGLRAVPYKEIADALTDAGDPTSLNDVKKARTRGGDPKPHTIPADDPGVIQLIGDSVHLPDFRSPAVG